MNYLSRNKDQPEYPSLSAVGRRSFSEGDLRFSIRTDCHSWRPSADAVRKKFPFFFCMNKTTYLMCPNPEEKSIIAFKSV